MTVLDYIKSVKNSIVAKHEGETYFTCGKGDVTPLETRSTYEILAEIDALQGLNVRERVAARKSTVCV